MSLTLCRVLGRGSRLSSLSSLLPDTAALLTRANGTAQASPVLTRRAPPCSAERRKPRVARKVVTRVGDGGEQGSREGGASVQTLPRQEVLPPRQSAHAPIPTAPALDLGPLPSPLHSLPLAPFHAPPPKPALAAQGLASPRSLTQEAFRPAGSEDEARLDSPPEPGTGHEDSPVQQPAGRPRGPPPAPLYRLPGGLGSGGKNSKVRSAEFIKSSPDVAQCPADGQPEIAVIGRSNVGKSSLVNMLTNRRELAQTSKKPGKTQLINHFLINGKWYLVDLPGYGYAKAPTAVRTEWHGFTQNYFLNRPNLVTVLLLVDASIPPLQVDLDCADWLGQNKIPVTVVFTKCDRRKKKKNGGRPPAENVADFEQRLSEYYEELPPWIMTSSVVSMGKDTLLGHIAQVIEHWKS